MSETFELRITLLGPERDVETNYGPRTDRDTLATLQVPVDGNKGWRICREAIAHVLQPDFIVTLPDGLSEQEAERMMEEFSKDRRL